MSVWVTLDDTECYAKFSELLVLLMLNLGVHCAYTGNQNFIQSNLSAYADSLFSAQIQYP